MAFVSFGGGPYAVEDWQQSGVFNSNCFSATGVDYTNSYPFDYGGHAVPPAEAAKVRIILSEKPSVFNGPSEGPPACEWVDATEAELWISDAGGSNGVTGPVTDEGGGEYAITVDLVQELGSARLVDAVEYDLYFLGHINLSVVDIEYEPVAPTCFWTDLKNAFEDCD